MSDGQTNGPSGKGYPPLNEDLVYKTLADPSRRAILLALAHRSPQTAVELQAVTHHQLDATRKQLEHLRASGLVIMTENPRDGRKALYSLTPRVRVHKAPSRAVLDFGFCTVLLKERAAPTLNEDESA